MRGGGRGSPCSILDLLSCSTLSPRRHELLSLMEPSRVGVSTQALPLALRVPGCLSPLLSWGATHSTPCQPLTCPACPLSSSLRKWQLHPLTETWVSPQQALPNTHQSPRWALLPPESLLGPPPAIQPLSHPLIQAAISSCLDASLHILTGPPAPTPASTQNQGRTNHIKPKMLWVLPWGP